MSTAVRSLFTTTLAALVFAGCSTPPTTEVAREEQSDEVQTTIDTMTKKDAGIGEHFQEAYGYAVFPSVGKAAVGVGGAYGRGQVFEEGVFIGYSSLSQATIGLALGGQSFAEVIFFKDVYALRRFTKEKYELAAQASAVAVKAGASTDANYNDGVMIFTMAHGGAMVEASIGGQKFEFEKK